MRFSRQSMHYATSEKQALLGLIARIFLTFSIDLGVVIDVCNNKLVV